MSLDFTERYARQIAVPEIGLEGQRAIGAARVLVVGAGGLGCIVLPYLVAAGVQRLIVVDPDRVEESNLHRQPLYQMSDLGVLKAQAVRARLAGLGAAAEIEARSERLTPANVASLVAGADVIVDAADSFAVTYVLSDECVRVGKPLVSASVLGLSGYVGAFCGTVPSYRAVFPELPRQAGTCAANGVLGTAVAVIGALQAQLTISLVLPTLRDAAAGKLITMDCRTLRMTEFSFRSAREEAGSGFQFIAPEHVRDHDVAVELRNEQEAPTPAVAGCIRLGVDHIHTLVPQLRATDRVVLCCRTGLRAWRAATRLKTAGHQNLALIAAGD